MTRILFDSRANFQFVLSKIHQQYEENDKYGVSPISIFHNKVDFDRNKNISNKDLLQNFFVEDNSVDIKYIEFIEKKYSPTTFWNIVLSDRYIKDKSEKFIINNIYRYLIAWERIIEKYKPDVIITEPITGLWNYSLSLICNKNSIKYLGFHSTRTTNKYYFSNDLFGKFLHFENYYNSLQKLELELSSIIEVRTFIQEFTKEKTVAEYLRKFMKLPSIFSFTNLFSLIRGLRRDFRRIYMKKYDYTIGLSINDYYYNIKRVLRILTIKLLKIFDKIEPTDNYILFPLHYQPEATTDIWAPYFSDQIKVIEYLSRSLPIDYKLYVKEHNALLGSKKISFYFKVKKYQNVRLIKPFINIHELILKSKAVAVITGTTGLEAIFYNKPVVVFGNVFYDFYPYIHKIKDLGRLSFIIKDAINLEIDDEDNNRIKFLYAYIMSGYSPSIFNSNLKNNDIESFISHIKNEISSEI